jgi:hypothetical protein
MSVCMCVCANIPMEWVSGRVMEWVSGKAVIELYQIQRGTEVHLHPRYMTGQ